MSIYKCKMCGGSLEVQSGEGIAKCEYCGIKQTLPKTDDENITNLFIRANNLRLKCEFDKAARLFEKILEQDNSEAEAHWGLVLCKYGIEYVEDPETAKRIPTCHRTCFDAITADADYIAAVDYADAQQQLIYEEEARAIARIQRDILAIAKEEEPFDVFICYKETDADGKRTPDSVLANDLYYQLTEEGFKVFFSRITLEGQLGTAYEPYIFAALNSAKVMVVLGTKPEYFQAVWVRNEWNRYLTLIKRGAEKVLIPAYRDMDPYDLPEEFAHLQAQDMSKLGFMQDLIRGIQKITQADKKEETEEKTEAKNDGISTASLLKRVFLFLEDGDWNSADEYCEKVLDREPENAKAYLGKLMAELHVHKQEKLADCDKPFDGRKNYQKIVRFGGAELAETLKGYTVHIAERNKQARLEKTYAVAMDKMENAKIYEDYKDAADMFSGIKGYRDADSLAETCLERMEESKKTEWMDKTYKDACFVLYSSQNWIRKRSSIEFSKTIFTVKNPYERMQEAIRLFSSIPGWKDSEKKIQECLNRTEELKKIEEKERKRKILMVILFIITGILCCYPLGSMFLASLFTS